MCGKAYRILGQDLGEADDADFSFSINRKAAMDPKICRNLSDELFGLTSPRLQNWALMAAAFAGLAGACGVGWLRSALMLRPVR